MSMYITTRVSMRKNVHASLAFCYHFNSFIHSLYGVIVLLSEPAAKGGRGKGGAKRKTEDTGAGSSEEKEDESEMIHECLIEASNH